VDVKIDFHFSFSGPLIFSNGRPGLSGKFHGTPGRPLSWDNDPSRTAAGLLVYIRPER
jgi:hypothetical protein